MTTQSRAAWRETVKQIRGAIETADGYYLARDCWPKTAFCLALYLETGVKVVPSRVEHTFVRRQGERVVRCEAGRGAFLVTMVEVKS